MRRAYFTSRLLRFRLYSLHGVNVYQILFPAIPSRTLLEIVCGIPLFIILLESLILLNCGLE